VTIEMAISDLINLLRGKKSSGPEDWLEMIDSAATMMGARAQVVELTPGRSYGLTLLFRDGTRMDATCQFTLPLTLEQNGTSN
jgi:hypothetical protein